MFDRQYTYKMMKYMKYSFAVFIDIKIPRYTDRLVPGHALYRNVLLTIVLGGIAGDKCTNYLIIQQK